MTKKNIIDISENLNFNTEDLELSVDYLEFITETWHNRVPETRGYTVCPKQEATHVVFSRLDLALVGEYGEDLSIHRVYPIGKDEDSGEILIFDDTGQTLIGFDVYIPCEYLKELKKIEYIEKSNEICPSNVISLSEYKNNIKQ